MEQQCTRCKTSKSTSEFTYKNKVKGTFADQCKVCRRATAKASYERNKRQVVSAVGVRTKSKKLWYTRLRSSLGCYLCTETDVSCLDVHHFTNEKDSDPSKIVVRASRQRIIDEFSKCICVCANCHRKIHAGMIMLLPSVEGIHLRAEDIDW